MSITRAQVGHWMRCGPSFGEPLSPRLLLTEAPEAPLRFPLNLLIALAAVGALVVIWWLSGGRALVFLLPLLFGLPLLRRR